MKEQRTSPNSMETKEYLKTSSRLFSSPSSPTSSSPPPPPSSCFVVVLPSPFSFSSFLFFPSFLPSFYLQLFYLCSKRPRNALQRKFFSITFCILGLKCRMHFLLSLESPRVNKPRTLKWPKRYISSLSQTKFCRTYLDTDTCLFSSY